MPIGVYLIVEVSSYTHTHTHTHTHTQSSHKVEPAITYTWPKTPISPFCLVPDVRPSTAAHGV